MRKKIKVLIVDDSALIRNLLAAILSSDHRFEVVGLSADPYEARESIKALNPDVMTLDIEMPKMNGITFLKNLMRLRPMPVVMVSTLTQAGAPATLEALELGAIDYVAKPQGDDPGTLEIYSQRICDKVYWAAKANVHAVSEAIPSSPVSAAGKIRPGILCAIGASTGGTEAIKHLVSALPETAPPIVITQHIPAAFSASFAKRLNGASAMTVCEAQHQQPIEPGWAYLAPGHSHLRVKATASGFCCLLDEGPEINRHRPSVEPLFDSVREAAGAKALAIMLTGMGADGAEALLRLKTAGAKTLVQDEASSVVWGMPGAAFKLGAACQVLPLQRMAGALMRWAETPPAAG
jgi:two-component system, chemotaxis family, protein-glutamate methylesterase/glutaminase